MSRDGLALAAAAATGVQVGAALVATRLVVHEIGPATLTLARYGIAALCLLPAAAAFRNMRLAPRDLLAVAVLGALQFGVLIAILNLGLRFIDATRAALIFSSFPLITMVLAVGLGREPFGLARAAGVAVTIAGVAAALGEVPDSREGAWIGAVCVLAAAFCGAICSVAYRPYLQLYPTPLVGFIAMLASVVGLAPVAALELTGAGWPRLGSSGWFAVLFIGLSSGVGYLLWLWALKHASPTRVTVFLALSPLTTALVGATFLGEPLTIGAMIGIAAVALGLWLAVGPHSLRASRPA